MKEKAAPMREDVAEELAATSSGPKGIGMAVAFDWGLAVQLLVMPWFIGTSNLFKQFNTNTAMPALISFVVSLPFAVLFVLFGEGIRRGKRWLRPWQIVFNSLGILGGILSLFTLWQGIKQGNYWSLVTTVILLVFSPLIVWRLSRPETAHWFATVKSSEARQRHGGIWIACIILWALVGGILQTMAASNR